jgi:hypothetical protein
MTTFDVPAVETAELRARARVQDGGILAHFAGSADSRDVVTINGFLVRLHAEAMRLAKPEVVVDFREFDFMNSSCFKAFVTWIGSVQDLEPSKQYKIRFLSDANKHWQRRSLDALRCFAVDLIHVEA